MISSSNRTKYNFILKTFIPKYIIVSLINYDIHKNSGKMSEVIILIANYLLNKNEK